MNKGKLIVANWKMNFLYKNAFNFCKKILLKKKLIKNKFVICPPTTLILQLSSKFKGITFGAQDCHYEKFGAYTGDISALMLKDINCKHVIIGHSERRKYFTETDEIISRKISIAWNHELNVIFCIGETLEERNNGLTNEVIETQLAGGLAGLGSMELGKLIVAYEPVPIAHTGS